MSIVKYNYVKEKCPAKGQEYGKCHKQGYFARVCKEKFVNKIDKSDDIENDIQDYNSRLSAINKLTKNNPQAPIRAIINGLTCLMEFYSSARISTVGQMLWYKLGQPKSAPLCGLTGYGKTPLAYLGKLFFCKNK